MLRVLIVEDDIEDRNGIIDFIPWAQLDCKIVATAENGKEGLEAAVLNCPDLILTDISMPVMDGIEMTKKICEELPDTQIIFMSCFDDFKFAQEAVNSGVVMYVLKPIKLNEMSTAIQKVKEKKEKEAKLKYLEKDLRHQLKKNEPILQEHFFNRLFLGNISHEKNIEEQAVYLNIKLGNMFCLVILQLDYINDTNSSNYVDTDYLYITMLRANIDENIMKRLQLEGYFVNYARNALAIIINCDCFSGDDLINILAELQSKFLSDTGITVTIGIGNVIDNVSKLPSEFKRLVDTVKREYFSKSGTIITSMDIDAYQDAISTISFDEIKSDIQLIFSKTDNTDVFIDELVNKYYIKGERYYETKAKSISFYILSTIYIILLERNLSFGEIFGSDIVVWEKMDNFKTILDIKQWIKNILVMLKKYMDDKENNRSHQTIEKIKQIIEKDYASIQVLSQIAERVYMSVGYSNRLFKKYTGETIFDYLLKTRMEVAKVLLKNAELKVYEISVMIGYSSYNYFASSFKQYVGLTPNEYRTNCCSR